LLKLAPIDLTDSAVIAGSALMPLLISEATKPEQAVGEQLVPGQESDREENDD
jgi:hypothetical protein